MRVRGCIVQMPEPLDKAVERSHGRPRVIVHAKEEIGASPLRKPNEAKPGRVSWTYLISGLRT